MARAKEGDELKKAEIDRVSAAEQAKKKDDLEKLKAKGEFEDVIKTLESQIEDVNKRHGYELQQRDIRNELLRAGFSNEQFILGSIVGYKPDGDYTISDYVDKLAKDTVNAAFLGTVSIREPKDPPIGVGSMGSKPDWNQVKMWENSNDKNERSKARELIKEHRKVTGEYPYEKGK